MAVQIRELTNTTPTLDNSIAAQNDSFNVIPGANSVYDLYTVPTGKTAIVKAIRVLNTHTAEVKLNLYFMRPNATGQYRRRQLCPVDMKLPPSFQYIDTAEVTLEAGDRIQGKADVANVLHYVITGVEREVV